MQAILRGLKPCIIGIIMATGIFMILNNAIGLTNNFNYDIKAIILTVILAVIMFASKPILKKKISPIVLIIVSAVCGIVVYGL